MSNNHFWIHAARSEVRDVVISPLVPHARVDFLYLEWVPDKDSKEGPIQSLLADVSLCCKGKPPKCVNPYKNSSQSGSKCALSCLRAGCDVALSRPIQDSAMS